jgi:hypothetical protein
MTEMSETGVSEEHIACHLLVSCLACSSTLKRWALSKLHGVTTLYIQRRENIKFKINNVCTSTDGIAIGYGLDDRGVGVRVPVGSRIFTSPRRPDRFWGPPSLLSNGYRGRFPRGKAAGA